MADTDSSEVVEVAYVEVSTPAGRLEPSTIRSITPDHQNAATPIKTMNRTRRAIGFAQGIPDYTADMEVAIVSGTPDVDWFALWTNKTRFAMTWEEGEGGLRYTAATCILDGMSKPFTAENGETRMSLKVKMLDVTREQI